MRYLPIRFCGPLVIWVMALVLILAACGGSATIPTDEPQPTAHPTPDLLPGSGVVVQPARANWDTGYFSEALYSRALEALGYQVLDHKELTNADFYQAVAQGDVDFWANGWFPGHHDFLELYPGKVSIAGTVAAYGALQGYLVDKAGAEEFKISSLADFGRPEVRLAYDTDGNGKADLLGCQSDWKCSEEVAHQLDKGDLRDYIDEHTGPYSDGIQDKIARFRKGEHILFYTWTPNWTVSQLKPGVDVVWIEAAVATGPWGQSKEELTMGGVEGCVKDPCLMGFVGADIKVVSNTDFLENNPTAAKLFEVMTVPLGDISKQNNRMNAGENTQEDIDAHAEEWIALNRDLFDGWLAQARLAGQ
jgi:glycine betaine/proline transport system substrate-binding protein